MLNFLKRNRVISIKNVLSDIYELMNKEYLVKSPILKKLINLFIEIKKEHSINCTELGRNLFENLGEFQTIGKEYIEVINRIDNNQKDKNAYLNYIKYLIILLNDHSKVDYFLKLICLFGYIHNLPLEDSLLYIIEKYNYQIVGNDDKFQSIPKNRPLFKKLSLEIITPLESLSSLKQRSSSSSQKNIVSSKQRSSRSSQQKQSSIPKNSKYINILSEEIYKNYENIFFEKRAKFILNKNISKISVQKNLLLPSLIDSVKNDFYKIYPYPQYTIFDYYEMLIRQDPNKKKFIEEFRTKHNDDPIIVDRLLVLCVLYILKNKQNVEDVEIEVLDGMDKRFTEVMNNKKTIS